MILALDPGTAHLGWAVVAPQTGKVAALGVLAQLPNRDLASSTDRAVRAQRQAALFGRLNAEHSLMAIAHEAASFQPGRFAMTVGLSYSIGCLIGSAMQLDLDLYEVPPKRWQHAVLGRDPKDTSKVDYEAVFARLAQFVGTTGTAADQLRVVKKAERNHALDAVGIGVFVALRREQATRIDWTP